MSKYYYIFTFSIVLFLGGTTNAATITSSVSGNWNNTGTWDSGTVPGAADDVIIAAGHTITLGGNTYCKSLVINATGELDDGKKKLYILGNVTLNGEWTGGGKFFMLGSSASIDGTGTINGTGTLRIEPGTKTILPSANLNMVGVTFDLRLSGLVNNQGEIVCKQINGADNSSVWTNKTGSGVAVLSGMLLGNERGILVSSALNNTVTYKGTVDQLIYATTYYNLIIDNAGKIATLDDAITVSNNLTITSGSLETDPLYDYAITLGGNWSNSGTFNENLGTVTLNGTGNQTITNASGELFYNLYLSNPIGSTTLGGDVTVFNTLTMAGGNVASNGNVFELGTSTINQGTLVRTSGEISGIFKRWVATTGTDYLFPIETSSNYYGTVLNFTNLSSGSMQIEFIQTNPGNNGLSLFESVVEVTNQFTEGFWRLTPADGLSSNDYDIRVEAAASIFDDYTINAATRLMYRVNSASAHTLSGTHQSATDEVIYRNGLTSASGEFSVGHTNCIPPVPTGLTGTAAVCTSQTNVSYEVDPTVGSTYTWTITGGIQATGGTTDSITVDWGITGGPGLVSLVEDEAGGCSPSEAIEYNVTINPILLTISGSSQVCSNGTEAYSVTNTSGSTYAWVIAGGTQASGGSTNTITVDWGSGGTGSVKVTETTSSCGVGIQETLNVNIDYLSAGSGNWDVAGTWVGGVVPPATGCVTIQNSHTVTLTVIEYIGSLTIASGGTLADGNKRLYVTGDITFDGDWSGVGMGQVTMTGDGGTIDGTGTITGKNKLQFASGTYTIKSTAAFTMNLGSINLLGGAVVVNNGNVTTVQVTGKDATSTWTQGSTGTLNVDIKLFGIGKGTLNASVTGNTINYNQNSNNVLVFATTYYNLIIDKTGKTATLEGNTTVLNDFTVTNGTFDTDAVSNYSLSVGGNWSNSATFNENTSTITLNGSGVQTISNAEQFYNLVVNKPAGTLNISSDVIVSNLLTMTKGNISTSTNKLTLGTSTGNTGSLTHTAGNILGKFERWINATGTDIIFPLGTASNSNKMAINFTNLGTSGSLITEFIASDPGSTGIPYFESPVNITNQFTEGYWKTTAANSLASTDYDINLLADGFSSYTISSPTRLCTRVSSGVGWFTNVDGTHGSAVGNTVYRTNCTGGATREFGLGNSDCAAPVTSSITGDNDVFINDLAEAYSVTNTIGSTYSWTITGGTQASGGTTNSITVDWGATGMTDGDVQVIETVTCGDGAAVNLTVEIGPTTDTIIGPDTVAESSSGLVYSVSDIAGSTFDWTVTGGGTITSGDGTYTINVDWSTSQTGNVRVVETDAV
ncbi:MAG: hypothetical protein IH948_00575, partial [Bacteroidetes bacterium]|nr:hypothetical protein [Bacteroidota bacterium]